MEYSSNYLANMCGFHRCRPNWLQSCASIKWFTACYGVTSLLTSSLSMYMVSQITTIERQFGFSSTRSGQLMACNDIGFSAFVLIASYSANKVNIPRFLCLSTILYGISGILCSVPHFLHPPQPLGADVNRTDTQLRRSFNETRNFSAHVQTQSDGTGNSDSGTVALAFIAIGMVLQGVGKAPRSPMAGKYLDDNTKPRETGFYMGIVQTLAIFGPAIAYGLGGLFSQVYVTLEPVEIHPRDPRWIGAWWLGFLVFGVAAIVFAVPLALFPSSFCATPKVAANRAPREQCCRRTMKDVIGIFTSSYRTLRIREYSLLLVANILNVIGYSAFMSFAPKYLEVQFNMPPWSSNVILGAFGIPAVCIGTFGGGLLTRKLKLTPSRCSLVMFLPQIPCLILTFVTMCLYCDQPRIHNWAQQRSNFLPAPCGGDRICSNNFLPVCAGNGVNYFSPCHAGCSEGTHFKFTNCTCVETGEVSPGLCKFDNCDKLWWVVAVNFVGTVLGASVMMPGFIFNLRIVPDKLKSMSIGISSLAISLFAFLPGPVIGGMLVDAACILWTGEGDARGSCSFYDNSALRNNIYGFGIACRAGAIVLVAVIVCLTWHMDKWPGRKHKAEVDFVYESHIRGQEDALVAKDAAL